jgi:hypothetical protein
VDEQVLLYSLSQTDSTAKVYFPLNIQNDSAFAQDYKLYASRTSVEPTLITPIIQL